MFTLRSLTDTYAPTSTLTVGDEHLAEIGNEMGNRPRSPLRKPMKGHNGLLPHRLLLVA